MNDQKNMILAIVLSAVVLLAWQFYFGIPQMGKQREAAQQQAQQQAGTGNQPTPRGSAPAPGGGAQAPAIPGTTPAAQPLTRARALAESPRVKIDTPRVKGSIALKGARIDDISLSDYRETVDKNSPAIVLLSPEGAPDAFFGEFGWSSPASADEKAAKIKLPRPETEWAQEGAGALSVGKPVVLTWDNGEGLLFRRTITVDDKYLFTVKDDVVNKTGEPITLFPYALISRHGTPHIAGYYILHEGLIGILSEKNGETAKLQEVGYADIEKKKELTFDTTNGWLGITDKYWAATLLPETTARIKARFTAETVNNVKRYQTDYLLDPQTIQPGATGTATGRLFAGAKEVAIVDAYENDLKLDRFNKLIDWGYLYFITKPMFVVIDYLYRLLGNFGWAILAVTVLIKAVFFPLANKSYASMAKMKAVQPEMMAIRDRYPDDKVKQQQAMMELYKKEKINPLAGCLPILIQVPVFFALYKVLFISIEMRHAPFIGWIKDLSAPDPTTIFNLFGLIPWDPSTVPLIGAYLMLGVWPIVMGITMWMQMKMNPTPPDPTQKMIFDWMPLVFTFMLSSFAAGLVIYWAWNNLLSVIQQGVIMRRNGTKIELFDNLKSLFPKGKKASG